MPPPLPSAEVAARGRFSICVTSGGVFWGRLESFKIAKEMQWDLDSENIHEQTIYEYQTNVGLQHAIDPEVVQRHSSVATTQTDVREDFKNLLAERDGYCVWSGDDLVVSEGMHLIPFARGDEFQLILENRFHEGEDLEGIHINDIRNGITGTSSLHKLFDRRSVAILKTPNPILERHHIPAMHDRQLPEGASYPDDSRYTLQWITTKFSDVTRSRYPHNSDAAFIDHNLPKPSDLLLHYMYGAAMLQEFGVGDYKELLLTRAGVPRPEPPPKVPTAPTRTVGDRSRTIAKLEQARQGQGGGWGQQQGGSGMSRPIEHTEGSPNQKALDAETIVLHFWANSPAARKRRARIEADQKERVENWRSGVTLR